MTFLGFENPPGVPTEKRVEAWIKSRTAWFNSIYLNAHEDGGHFAAYENPGAVVEDIRATLRKIRSK